MNEEKQKILNIFNPKEKLKNPESQRKQEKIEQLIKETFKIEGIIDDKKSRN